MIEERCDFSLSLYQCLGTLGAHPGALELSLKFCDALGRCRFGCLRGLRGLHLEHVGFLCTTRRWPALARGPSGATSELTSSLRLALGGEVRGVEPFATEKSGDLAGLRAALRSTEGLLLVGRGELAPLGCG